MQTELWCSHGGRRVVLSASKWALQFRFSTFAMLAAFLPLIAFAHSARNARNDRDLPRLVRGRRAARFCAPGNGCRYRARVHAAAIAFYLVSHQPEEIGDDASAVTIEAAGAEGML
jgi:hypothetical protein